jgi:hypothetical protein
MLVQSTNNGRQTIPTELGDLVPTIGWIRDPHPGRAKRGGISRDQSCRHKYSKSRYLTQIIVKFVSTIFDIRSRPGWNASHHWMEQNMPGEIRYLVFSGTELCEAIEKYGRRTLSHFPIGTVVKAEIVDDDEPSVNVVVQNGALSVVQYVRSDDLLKVMIRYLHDKRIPLPARGTKRVRSVNGVLACEVAMEDRHRRCSPISPMKTSSGKRSIPDQIRLISATRSFR